jgi:isopenicillin N synthase-like dioxygenase
MALVHRTVPSGMPSPITKLIARLRGRNIKDETRQPTQEDAIVDSRLPLVPSPLPLVLPEHQQALSNLGWTTITFPQSAPVDPTQDLLAPGSHPLQSAYEALFSASQAFFAQPSEEKARWKHKLRSEEGWSSIPGEKEFITLRTLEYCPEVLRAPAKRYWDLMGAHLENTLGRIATSLDIPQPDDAAKGLKKFVGPCGKMQAKDEEKTATMLRLFRYEGWEAKEVAEPHADLGLLSVVVGNVPGLEVWDGEKWFEVEKEVEKTGMKGASLLSGRQLERFSNGRYPAGGHRVVSYGDPAGAKNGNPKYRFSIVFVLRAHDPVVINSQELETPITGKWSEPVQSMTAGELYARIRGAHFNINIGQEERDRQRKNLRKMKEKEPNT